MSDEEFDEIDDDEPDLDEDLDIDEDTADDALELDDDLAVEVVVADPVGDDGDDGEDDDADASADPGKATKRTRAKKSDDDEDVLELDEELHPDDIEEPLDVLLQERTAAASLEDDEEDAVEEIEVDDRVDGATKIVPRRPGEFLCASCFLVLPRAQLADEKRMLCRDCA